MKWRRGLIAEVILIFREHPEIRFNVLALARLLVYTDRDRLKMLLGLLVEMRKIKYDDSEKAYYLPVKKKR
jgi:hypothetical protein